MVYVQQIFGLRAPKRELIKVSSTIAWHPNLLLTSQTPVLKAHGCHVPQWEWVSRYKVPLPSPQEQRRIAHILGTLDDKIELNRQMNETLEATAWDNFQIVVCRF